MGECTCVGHNTIVWIVSLVYRMPRLMHRFLIPGWLVAITWSALAGQLAAESPGPATSSLESGRWFNANAADWVELYVELHRNPEVSFFEDDTADRLATRWRALGLDVTTKIGGHGIVGILKNGSGPTIMLRTDLDALPVQEQTGLPYASTTTTTDGDIPETFVMHACGHDVHMTNLTTVAAYLSSHRELWSGTLMLIGQPAEERGAGATAMLRDGLFERFPKPDAALAIHVAADLQAGRVGYRPGFSQANVDSVDITMLGRGGHGSKPETTIDPVMLAAELVVSLQTIVSREIKPTDPAVVTVGSIHGGTKHNIIGNDCHLQLTVRSYDPGVRAHLLDAIQRKAKAVAMGSRAPEPIISVSEGTPSLFNDESLTMRVVNVFQDVLGKDQVVERPPSMGGEDFSQYGIAGVPVFMYAVGTVSARQMELAKKTGVPPPSLHSSKYAPDLETTLQTAFMTLTAAVLELMASQ